MPVPKRKVSKSRRDMRSAHKGLKFRSFTACSNCSEPIAPHTACAGCGYYKGAKVLETKSDRLGRRQVQQAKAQSEAAAPEVESKQA